MTYEQALDYLAGLSKFGINLGLTRIEKLLELMNQPQRRYKTIHVTGTNGKGSTTVLLTRMLSAAGIRTGMYISPHLVDYTERITVNGAVISHEAFGNAVAYTAGLVEQMVAEGYEHPTEFEVLTAAAFYYFAAAGVEYAVIEVGLGGLMDSTNVIVPEVAVITNVTLEHTDRCGKTVAEIAFHKAGIIKDGVPVITGAQGDALRVVRETAERKQAPLYSLGADFSAEFAGRVPEGQLLRFSTRSAGEWQLMPMRLLGRHQAENGGLAVMAALLLASKEQRITEAAIRLGLAQAVWPGRFEVVPGQPTIVIDGAHNPDGAKRLRAALDDFFPQEKRVFVLGILADKDIDGIARVLIRPSDRVITVRPPSERAAAADVLAGRVQAASVEAAGSIAAGLRRAKELAGPEGLICLAGSLYLIGAARPLILK